MPKVATVAKASLPRLVPICLDFCDFVSFFVFTDCANAFVTWYPLEVNYDLSYVACGATYHVLYDIRPNLQ